MDVSVCVCVCVMQSWVALAVPWLVLARATEPAVEGGGSSETMG